MLHGSMHDTLLEKPQEWGGGSQITREVVLKADRKDYPDLDIT